MRGRESNRAGAKLHTSVPVVIETFTFLSRNASRDVALTWKDEIYKPATVNILPCEPRDLEQSWGILPASGPAQAVGRRRHQLCDHEAGENPACIRF
jgi:hypothetical protein